MTTLLDDGSVEFRLYRPEAVSVRLAGTFSHWQPELPMIDLHNGWWHALLRLPPGEHRFRYEVDGRWFTDFASSGIRPTDSVFDSIVVVPHPSSPDAPT